MKTVGNAGANDARLAASRLCQGHDGRKIALEIAPRNAEPGLKISSRPDPSVQFERRYDLVPVGADVLRQLRQRIGSSYRGDQAAVDRNFGQLRTLIPHRQDRTTEGAEQGCKGFGQRPCRLGTANNISLRSRRALDRASEYQRLDLVE